MDTKGFGSSNQHRFMRQVKNFEFWVKSDVKSGLTITKELTVWYSDQLEKFYDQSAALDKWIRELYALQLSLEMMVNTWNINVAAKTAKVTALEGVNSKLDITIRQLKSEIVGHKTKLKELTQLIEVKMRDISEQDRRKQESVQKLEILINKISGSVKDKACKAGIATNLIAGMTKIQSNIDRIEKAQSV